MLRSTRAGTANGLWHPGRTHKRMTYWSRLFSVQDSFPDYTIRWDILTGGKKAPLNVILARQC